MACRDQYPLMRKHALVRMALAQVTDQLRKTSEREIERVAASQESDPKAAQPFRP